MTKYRDWALVTGGAKRLGAAIARHLTDGGWSVVIHYNSAAQDAEALAGALRKTGAGVACLGADLSDPQAAETLVDRAFEAAGGALAGIVNSASIFEYDLAGDFTPQNWIRHQTINALAPALIARRYAALLRKDARGAVVNILDQKLWNMNPDFFAYTMSKATLKAATEALAMALAPKVRVCGVAPGLTLPSGAQTQEEFDAVAGKFNLAQRPIALDDITSAVRFALENDALFGSVLLVDNGQHLVSSNQDIMFDSRGRS